MIYYPNLVIIAKEFKAPLPPFREGRGILLVDDENRENEGDLSSLPKV